MCCAVSDWEACGDTFYCEEHLYDLHWQDVDLDTHKCVQRNWLQHIRGLSKSADCHSSCRAVLRDASPQQSAAAAEAPSTCQQPHACTANILAQAASTHDLTIYKHQPCAAALCNPVATCPCTPSLRPYLCRVAAAPFGGPVAVVRDEQSLVVIRSGATGGRPLVRIFSASGQLQGSFLWEGARLLAWGWSNELELVMVDVAGKVRCDRLVGLLSG